MKNALSLSILPLLFLILVGSLNAQSNKFTHELSEYGLSITIDTNLLKRITYDEMKQEYKNTGHEIDEFLRNINVNAVFLYDLKKEHIRYFYDENSIRIEVIKDNGVNKPYLLNADDTIHSITEKGFLNKLRTYHTDSAMKSKVRVYYDSASHTYISKYLTTTKQMAGFENQNPKNKRSLKEPHFMIFQIFLKNGYYFKIQYNCFQSEQAMYFKLFERIIGSVH